MIEPQTVTINGQPRLVYAGEGVPRLEPCPFCGNPAYLRYYPVYDTPAVVAECFSCHGKGVRVITGTNVLGVNTDLNTAIEKAAAQWNQRLPLHKWGEFQSKKA